MNGHITLDELRRLWMPISPQFHLDRLAGRDVKTLLVYAPRPHVSGRFVTKPGPVLQRETCAVSAERPAVRPLQHGLSAVQHFDGAVLTRFLHKALK